MRTATAVSLLAALAVAAGADACTGRHARSPATSTTPVTGVVEGPTLPSPAAGLAPLAGGTIIVAYLMPGTTVAEVRQLLDTEEGLWQAHQRAGQLGLIPVSLTPDYPSNLVRIVMSANASAADIASFKAELLRISLIERVS